jgi:hypothetical protein
VKRNYLILILLAIVFVCPGIAAYLFFNHPQWLSSAAINKGKLINPPEILASFNSKPKWRLILWQPTGCDKRCYHHLDRLGRIRLSLGRRLYEVEEWLVMPYQSNGLPEDFRKNLSNYDIHLLLLPDDRRQQQHLLTTKAQIFIANPNGYLVLSYELTAKPDHIFHDLYQLLTSTDSKNR